MYAPPWLYMPSHLCASPLPVLAPPIRARPSYPCAPPYSSAPILHVHVHPCAPPPPTRMCPLAHMHLSLLCPNHSKFLTTTLPFTCARPLPTCARPMEYVFALGLPCLPSLDTYAPPLDPYKPPFNSYASYIAVCTPHPIWAGFTCAPPLPWKSTSPLPMPYQPMVLTGDKT
jgi:hypothetical protein